LVKIFDGQKELLTDQERNEIVRKTLELLNQGAPRYTIARDFSNAQNYVKPKITEVDVTNDGIPELIADIENGFAIYKCNNGSYEIILQWWGFDSVKFVGIDYIEDMNVDGVPEIVASVTACSGTGCRAFKIYEWDGFEMKNLIKILHYDPVTNRTEIYDEIGMDSPLSQDITDVNNDGTLEFIVVGGKGIFRSGDYAVTRQEMNIYSWDGSAFVPYSYGFTAPEYQFQAVQDADRETENGNWGQALSLYQLAISGKLNWWSAELQKDQDIKAKAFWNSEPTPSTVVQEDETEYPRLAAYAYYRMVILHTFLGEVDAAQVKYATLQEKFPAPGPGHPYAEMASAFWDAYQSSGRMYDACGAAIQYAAEHPEILTPLGSDYHGAQSHTYVPADVCPFR
jgi:hypothetical protein